VRITVCILAWLGLVASTFGASLTLDFASGAVSSPSNFPPALVLAGSNVVVTVTNTGVGWSVRLHVPGAVGWTGGGTNSRQWGSVLLSNLVSGNSWGGGSLIAGTLTTTNGINVQNKMAITFPAMTNITFRDWGGINSVTIDASNFLGRLQGLTLPALLSGALATNWSGSTNRAVVGPVTNQWDLSVTPWQRMTNDTGLKTNVVFQLTNALPGMRQWTVVYGNKAAVPSNEFFSVLFTWPGGGTISWLGGVPTNGSSDFLVRSNRAVLVEVWCDRATNVFARYATNNMQQ
jgi:hypothetical protein